MVAIVGNPNAGKTTLFNALTGSHQKVGNYPGVTVERVSGLLKLEEVEVECIDVPGMYSLAPVSEDERVAVDVVKGTAEGVREPDLLVCVIDVTNLERNLFLFTQVAEVGRPVVVALTMVDRLAERGQDIDLAKMANLLGIDVVPIVGHKDKGLDELKATIEQNLEHPKVPSCDLGLPSVLETRVVQLRERLARYGGAFTTGEVRRELLHPSAEFDSFLGEFPELKEAFDTARSDLKEEGVLMPALDVATRYRWADVLQRAVIRETGNKAPKRSITDRLDAILTHRVFGLAVFICLMYLVFQSIYTFATPLMDLIDNGFTWLGAAVGPKLEGTPILQSLVVDGLIKGVGGMLVFLPQIMILFFFIAVLEGTGYLARAAFLMDRLLGWCGLNGRAFIPLLSSFACAIPGIMAARVMPDPKSRLATILVAPLMSCSARLPVYLLLIGAFIQPQYGNFVAGLTLFAMHFMGVLLAVPIVWALNRSVLKGKRLPFLLELPPYQWPKWRDVWMAMYFRAKVFVQTAGTIIVVVSILIWALCYFPSASPQQQQATRVAYVQVHPNASEDEIQQKLHQEQLAHSVLGQFGKVIEPVFRPAGFDWRISTAILAAFPARETVVSAMGIIFSMGGDSANGDKGLQESLHSATWPDGRPLFTPWTAASLMVFFALCAQCMSTMATVKRETNSWKWPVFMFTYMSLLAYGAAVLIHQVGRLFGA